jgi:transcription initiation factor TFIID subunit 2
MKRKAWAAIDEREQGELAIAVSGGWVRLMEGDHGVEFAPIQIQIDYNLQVGTDVTDGIVFRQDVDGEVSPGVIKPTGD